MEGCSLSDRLLRGDLWVVIVPFEVSRHVLRSRDFRL
jgi:hypothetical protein